MADPEVVGQSIVAWMLTSLFVPLTTHMLGKIHILTGVAYSACRVSISM